MYYGTQSGCEGGSTSNTIPGSFGNGGSTASYHYSGGGGGYYGGGAVENSGGGGGSGFIGGVINYSSYHIISLSCESTFLSTYGLEVQGNDGPGYSRITLIEFASKTFFHNRNISNCLIPFLQIYFSPLFSLFQIFSI